MHRRIRLGLPLDARELTEDRSGSHPGSVARVTPVCSGLDNTPSRPRQGRVTGPGQRVKPPSASGPLPGPAGIASPGARPNRPVPVSSARSSTMSPVDRSEDPEPSERFPAGLLFRPCPVGARGLHGPVLPHPWAAVRPSASPRRPGSPPRSASSGPGHTAWRTRAARPRRAPGRHHPHHRPAALRPRPTTTPWPANA